jgi:hypothetical protein
LLQQLKSVSTQLSEEEILSKISEAEDECEDEREYGAVNGNQMLSICGLPLRPNQSRKGGEGRHST